MCVGVNNQGTWVRKEWDLWGSLEYIFLWVERERGAGRRERARMGRFSLLLRFGLRMGGVLFFIFLLLGSSVFDTVLQRREREGKLWDWGQGREWVMTDEWESSTACSCVCDVSAKVGFTLGFGEILKKWNFDSSYLPFYHKFFEPSFFFHFWKIIFLFVRFLINFSLYLST